MERETMPQKENQIKPPDEGFFREVSNQVRLILRLMADPRVSPWLKLLPIGSLIYLVVPFDFVPIIPVDDAVVIGLGTYMFIELCPPEIVQEHKEALNQVVPGVWRDIKNKEEDIDEADIVDGEFKER
jgi:uncharacterized membrane protein YkvA (DUF1232 family)